MKVGGRLLFGWLIGSLAVSNGRRCLDDMHRFQSCRVGKSYSSFPGELKPACSLYSFRPCYTLQDILIDDFIANELVPDPGVDLKLLVLIFNQDLWLTFIILVFFISYWSKNCLYEKLIKIQHRQSCEIKEKILLQQNVILVLERLIFTRNSA